MLRIALSYWCIFFPFLKNFAEGDANAVENLLAAITKLLLKNNKIFLIAILGIFGYVSIVFRIYFLSVA